MPETSSPLLAHLSEQLSHELVLAILGIDAGQTVLVGDMVKAHCPVCKTEAIKTLFLNIRKRSYVCRYTMCAAHAGGDWVQLIALARNLSEMETARLLIEELGLEVHEGEAQRLSEDLEAQGLAALASGDLAAARRLLEQAANSRAAAGGALHPDVAAKLAHCCFELGDPGAAREHWRAIIAHHIAAGETHNAILLLSDLIFADPEWSPELHLMLGRVLRGDGETGEALRHLLEAADGLRRLGQIELAGEAAREAAGIDPANDLVQRELAFEAIERGDAAQALANLDGLMRACEADGSTALAHAVLERLDAMGELPAPMRLRRAEALIAAGDTATALAVLAPAAESPDAGTRARAEALLDTLEPAAPVLALQLRFALAAQAWGAARARLEALLTVDAASQAEAIDGAFAVLLAAQPDDLALAARHLDWLEQTERHADLAASAQRLLRAAAASRDAQAAAAAWRWIAQMDLPARAAAIADWWQADASDECAAAWRGLIAEAERAGLDGLAHELAGRFLDDAGFDATVAGTRFATAKALGRLAGERGRLDAAVEQLMAQREWHAAAATLRLLMSLLEPAEADAQCDRLARILEQSGDTGAAVELWMTRAETALEGGWTSLAEQHLAAARRIAPDRWSLWRRERALARRAKHAGLSERLIGEALRQVGEETLSTPNSPVVLALIAEAADGVLESAAFAQLLMRMARGGDPGRAVALIQQCGETLLGRGIDGQRALVDLLQALPQSSDAWRLAIDRVNDADAVALLHQRLVAMVRSGGTPASTALASHEATALLERALSRWPDSTLCLEGLATAQRGLASPEEAANTTLRLVEVHLAAGRPEAAVEAIQALRPAMPTGTLGYELRTRLAHALEAAGRTAEAADLWLAIANELIPAAESVYLRGGPLDARAAIANARRLAGDTTAVLAAEFAHCEQAMDRESATERAIALAERHLSEGPEGLGEALALLRHCIDRYGETDGLLHAQARVFEQAGQTRAALRSHRTLLDRAWQAQSWSRCEEILQTLHRLAPGEVEDLERAAAVTARLGRPDDAEQHLAALVDDCLRAGRWLQATEILQRALEWLNRPLPALLRLAAVQRDNGQIADAVASLRRALAVAAQGGDADTTGEIAASLSALAPGDVGLRLDVLAQLDGLWDDARLASEHAALAQSLLREQRASDALSVCRRALDRWPGQPAVLRMAAEAHLESGQEAAALECLRRLADGADPAAAVDAWQRIVAMPGAKPDDRWSLVESLRAQGMKTEALEHLRLLADHHRARGEADDVIRALEWTLDLDPQHLGALTELPEALSQVGDLGGAIQRWLDLAQLHLARNRRAPAERALRQIVEHDPQHLTALELLVRLYEQQQNSRRLAETAASLLEVHAGRDWERAVALAADMAARHPDADEFFRRWASLLWSRGEHGQAIAELDTRAERLREAGRLPAALEMLDQLAALVPERTDLGERIGAIASELGETDRARRAWQEALAAHRALGDIDREHAVLAMLHRLDPDDLTVTAGLARTAEALGRVHEGIEHLTALLVHARLTGDAQEQMALLRRIVALDDSRADDHRALGELLAAAGDSVQAANHMRAALARQRLEGRWPEAAETAKRIGQLDPGDTASRQLHGEALVHTGRIHEALAVFLELAAMCQADHDYLLAEIAWRAVLNLQADHAVAREQLAWILAAQGQIAEAVSLWESLAHTHRAHGDTEAERQTLASITAAQPGNLAAHRRLAQLCMEVGEFEMAWVSFHALLEAVADSEAEWMALEEEILGGGLHGTATAAFDPRLRLELAQWHLDAGRRERALDLHAEVATMHRRGGNAASVRATCELMLKIDPQHIPALEMLVDAQRQLGDESGPALVTLQRKLAKAHAAKGQPDRALALLKRLSKDAPGDLDVLADLARTAQMQGQREETAAALQTMARLVDGPTSLDRLLGLGEELLGASPWPRVIREALAAALCAQREEARHPEVLAALAEDCERDGDIVRAAEIHQALLAAVPADVDRHLAFVEFLQRHGQQTRAVHEITQTGQMLLRQGDHRRAAAIFERARALDPASIPILHGLGQALRALNARGRALEALQQAAALARQQDQAGPMPALHREILEIDPSDMAARRALIEALQAQGEVDAAIEESLTLADQCVGRGLLDLAAQCYRMVVQHRPHDLRTWHLLIDTHLQFGAETDLLPDYVAIARIHAAEGQAREAVQWFQRYLALRPDSVEVRQEFLESYQAVAADLDLVGEYQTMAEVCRRAGQTSQAEAWQRRADRLVERIAQNGVGLRAAAGKTPAPPSPPPSPARAPAPRPAASPTRPGRAGQRPGPRSSLTASGASRQRVNQSSAPPPRPQTQDATNPMQRALQQYLTHLELDPRNAKMQRQVAEILHHLGRDDEAYLHWLDASEILLAQQHWDECLALCERLLAINPHDRTVQDRLRQARVSRDQMREIDRAIGE